MTSDPPDHDEPVSDQERAAAEALARALDGSGPPGGADEERAAAGLIRAASGDQRLGDPRARAIARAAIAQAAARAPSRRRGRWAAALGGVAAAALALLVALRVGRGPERPKLPEELQSRTAGRLVPGPFPPSQSAADRLDLVTADRMVALRELAVRRAAGRVR